MLDAHPMFNCGEETRIIPRIIQFTRSHLRHSSEQVRLEQAGITSSLLNNALRSYIMEILVEHNKNAPFLCAKDPTLAQSSEYLAELFPNSKFILMIRDARATVYSVISRFINSSGYKFRDFRNSFLNWNNITEIMYDQCLKIGSDRCLIVFYEKLVLQPKIEIVKILKFLNVPWNEAVLNHEKYIGDEISLSKSEKSSDQVIKPVYLDGLNSWVGKIPKGILDELDQLVPMMKKLGYDTKSKWIDYSLADEKVKNNTQNIKDNKEHWLKLAKSASNLHQFFVTHF